MPFVPIVLSDEPQADGRRYVRYRFTHTNGDVVDAGPYSITAETVALTDAVARAIPLEATRKEQEKSAITFYFYEGNDPASRAWFYHTGNDARMVGLRALFNLMRSEVQDEAKGVVASNVVPVLAPFTNSQIANLIDNPNWTATEVGNARTKLAALATAWDNLDHGEPEIE